MRQHDWIKIAIVRPDNILNIMTFLTKITMPNEEGIDTIVEVEPSSENIEREIIKSGGDFIDWKIIELEDIPTDRTYRNAWVLRNGTIEVDQSRATEIALNNIRLERNQKLIESDVYVLPDRWNTYTIEQQNAWTNYRKSLRDFPENVEDPFNPIWPEKPI